MCTLVADALMGAIKLFAYTLFPFFLIGAAFTIISGGKLELSRLHRTLTRFALTAVHICLTCCKTLADCMVNALPTAYTQYKAPLRLVLRTIGLFLLAMLALTFLASFAHPDRHPYSWL